MKYCSNCAAEVVLKRPAGDNRDRWCCTSCDSIHYQNPNLVLGTVPVFGDRVLLCRRAIEPRYGYWTLPAGFMENHETVAEGAARETREEAGIAFELDGLFSVISVPHVAQVHMFYRATMQHESMDPGEETLEAALFAEADIPWDRIAFRTVEQTLRWFFDDRRAGRFELHTDDVRYTPRPAAG